MQIKIMERNWQGTGNEDCHSPFHRMVKHSSRNEIYSYYIKIQILVLLVYIYVSFR